ncbi:secreted beta-glucosidase sun1 [Acrodontium crateriforme]|uniref:Secreted beta-glucosidase sun1 n=1 Tax=Acrodontium crateriforme TaxID=150365 RepID=A0AAQ3M5T2_9PEZI|nr:secreted beta-glucosidase sun1 [Acrodontium crateriforme]
MKVSVALLSAAVAVVAAQPHHQHLHLHKHHAQRAASPDPTVDTVVVPGPTVLAYVLNGHAISKEDVDRGIANGTLIFADNGDLASAKPSSTWVAPTTSLAPTTSHAAPTTSTSAPPSTSSSSSSSSAAASSSSAPAAAIKQTSNNAASSGSGVDRTFPSGQIACSQFPSDYGPIAVSWMGLGGWTGVQKPESWAIMDDIETMISGQGCHAGTFCSYACPAGYQKSQWPETQGTTGQSIGGLKCNDNGMLELTNSNFNTLCITGATEVDVVVQNNMGQDVAICRTDYPGTEGETVPLNAAAGQTEKLTCPDASNYYNWEGGKTSAQYYVNPAGVSVSDACQWGSSANPWGNYAPMNIGAGYSNGAAWLSMFANYPTQQSATLQYTVEIVGDNMSGKCRYQNGQYCSGDNYENCNSREGCTVSVSSGSAKFVFSN